MTSQTYIGAVVHKEDAHGTSIVSGRDGSKALLAGCVPNLKLYLFAIQLYGSNLEIDS